MLRISRENLCKGQLAAKDPLFVFGMAFVPDTCLLSFGGKESKHLQKPSPRILARDSLIFLKDFFSVYEGMLGKGRETAVGGEERFESAFFVFTSIVLILTTIAADII